eukprot:COSAG01_NODE_44524_length_418_cov_0.937304_1_plen_139_part_11
MVRKIVVGTGAVSTLAGSGPAGKANGVGSVATFNGPIGVSLSANGNFALVADHGNNMVRKIVVATGAVSTLAGSGSQGKANGVGSAATFAILSGVSLSADGSFALAAGSSNHMVRKVLTGANAWAVAGVTGLATCPAKT